MLGIIEIGLGIAIFIIIKQFGEESSDPSNHRERVEIATMMEDIRVSGGVDPQYMNNIQLQVSFTGHNPRNIITDPKDQVKSLAELLLFLQNYEYPINKRKIMPPPSPNSPSSALLVRERLKGNIMGLKGPSSVGTPSVFLTQ